MFPSRQQARTWSRAIGWFSIGLGVAELVASRPLARATGLHGRAALVRACGARELVNGVALLQASRPMPWMWTRVAGDALDMAALASARRGASPGALAAVGAVTALDVLCAKSLSTRAPASAFDYSGRSGPRATAEMRGAALADFAPPRDMRTPEAMRPWLAAAAPAPSSTREPAAGEPVRQRR